MIFTAVKSHLREFVWPNTLPTTTVPAVLSQTKSDDEFPDEAETVSKKRHRPKPRTCEKIECRVISLRCGQVQHRTWSLTLTSCWLATCTVAAVQRRVIWPEASTCSLLSINTCLFMTIVLGIGVECYLLVDVSPAARPVLVNLSSPVYLLSRHAPSPSLTCEKVSSTAFCSLNVRL